MTGNTSLEPARSSAHPLTSRYLEQLKQELSELGIEPDEISEILADIHLHLAEAQTTELSLGGAMSRLGSPQALAQEYATALTLGLRFEQRDPSSSGWIAHPTFVRLRPSLATVGRLSLALILGTVGLSSLLLGTAGVGAALVLPFVPSSFLDPTLRMGAPQLIVLAVSIAGALLGCFWLHMTRRIIRSRSVTARSRHEAQSTSPRAHQETSITVVPIPDDSDLGGTVVRPATWERHDS